MTVLSNRRSPVAHCAVALARFVWLFCSCHFDSRWFVNGRGSVGSWFDPLGLRAAMRELSRVQVRGVCAGCPASACDRSCVYDPVCARLLWAFSHSQQVGVIESRGRFPVLCVRLVVLCGFSRTYRGGVFSRNCREQRHFSL